MITDMLRFAKRRFMSTKLRAALLGLYLIFSIVSAVYMLCVGAVRNSLLSLAYPALVLALLFIVEYFLKLRCGDLFLLIALTVPVGGILGTCYEFYMIIPFFDTLLHTVSGFIFAALGYALMDTVLRSRTRSSKLAAILFAFAFSLALAVLWELFEWGLTVLTRGDMHEDSFVNEIRSYILSGSHNTPVILENIERTEIIYSGGQVYVIDGYLDLGLNDTLTDMLVCLIGATVFLAASLADLFAGKEYIRLFAPSLDQSAISSGETE